MAHAEAALKKLTKEDINFTLDLQVHFNQYFKCI